MGDLDATLHLAGVNAVCESAGLDWLNLTQPRSKSADALLEQGRAVVALEAAEGNDVRPFALRGYRGWSSGGASYGLRHDGVIVQLRSETAREHGTNMIPLAANVSRLDMQVTVSLDQPRPDFIPYALRRAKRHKGGRGRRAALRYMWDSKTGQTLYSGGRESDVMVRLYDKGAQEKRAEVGTIYRWEIQTRDDVAKGIAADLTIKPRSTTEQAAKVLAYAEARGISIPEGVIKGEQSPRLKKLADSSRRLAYLSTVVAPMIARLSEHYPMESIIGALGLAQLVTINRDED